MAEIKLVEKETGKRFQVGDKVGWTSQAGGHAKMKIGEVAAIVPPFKAAWEVLCDMEARAQEEE